jgi:hypothetical protein
MQTWMAMSELVKTEAPEDAQLSGTRGTVILSPARLGSETDFVDAS